MNTEAIAFYGLLCIAAFLMAYRMRQIVQERREERERFDADIATVRRDAIDDDAWPLLSEDYPIGEPDDGFPWDNVTPLHPSPAVDRISSIIAANEAARADWDEPTKWTKP